MARIMFAEANSSFLKAGPNILPGFSITISNRSASGMELQKSHAAFSDRILLLLYELSVRFSSAQSASVMIRPFYCFDLSMIAAVDDVMTTRLTLCFIADLSTFSVPSTAVLISLSSSALTGIVAGTGDATCTTY